MRVKETNDFYKSLGDVLLKRASWFSIDRDDRIDLLAQYAHADVKTCVEKFLENKRMDEFILSLLSFASKINHMDISLMNPSDVNALEYFQNDVFDIFNKPMGDVIEECIPFVISKVDHDDFFEKYKELEKVI
jgi:hypothetical protein